MNWYTDRDCTILHREDGLVIEFYIILQPSYTDMKTNSLLASSSLHTLLIGSNKYPGDFGIGVGIDITECRTATAIVVYASRPMDAIAISIDTA